MEDKIPFCAKVSYILLQLLSIVMNYDVSNHPDQHRFRKISIGPPISTFLCNNVALQYFTNSPHSYDSR
jgi:hypothetical protein